MGYHLIKGYFHLVYQSEYRLVGSRPDGDSMWFKPNNPAHLTKLGGRDVDYNGGGFAQMRFEGIDALELHYTGSHQKVPECVSARDRLLQLAGFKDVTYAPSRVSDIDTSVRTASPHPRKGYILSRNVDPYGRPVAFVFVGDTTEPDGSEIYLTAPMMARSLNWGQNPRSTTAPPDTAELNSLALGNNFLLIKPLGSPTQLLGVPTSGSRGYTAILHTSRSNF